jgi:hypothetical protein
VSFVAAGGIHPDRVGSRARLLLRPFAAHSGTRRHAALKGASTSADRVVTQIPKGGSSALTLADLDASFLEYRQEHHAIFDYHVSQKSRVFLIGAERMNTLVAKQRVK